MFVSSIEERPSSLDGKFTLTGDLDLDLALDGKYLLLLGASSWGHIF